MRGYQMGVQFLNNDLKQTHGIKHFFLYYPKEHDFSKVHKYSRMILEFKNGDRSKFRYFLAVLRNNLEGNFVIIPVPPSEPNKINSITRLAQEIASEKPGIIDGSGCLVRIKEIPKAHMTNIRDAKLHRESLKINNDSLFKGLSMTWLLREPPCAQREICCSKQERRTLPCLHLLKLCKERKTIDLGS